VLGDEGEDDSDDSDPDLVTGEASVGGSAGVSSGPSSFSHSTAAPGFSGAFGAPPAAPQARIVAPRIDTVKPIFRELAGKALETHKRSSDGCRPSRARRPASRCKRRRTSRTASSRRETRACLRLTRSRRTEPVQHHLRRDQPEPRRRRSVRASRRGDAARHPHNPGDTVRGWPRSAGRRIRRGCGCRAAAAGRGATSGDGARHSTSLVPAGGTSSIRERVHAAGDERAEPAAVPAGPPGAQDPVQVPPLVEPAPGAAAPTAQIILYLGPWGGVGAR